MNRGGSSIMAERRHHRLLRQAKGFGFPGLRCRQIETCFSDLLMRIEALEDSLFCRIISYAPEAFLRVSVRAAETWRFHRTFAMPLKCSEVAITLRRSPNLRCLFLGEYLSARAVKAAFQSRHINHLPLETLKLHLSDYVPEAYVLRLLKGLVRLRQLEVIGNCLPKLLPHIAKLVEDGQLEYAKVGVFESDFMTNISGLPPAPIPRLKTSWIVNMRVPLEPNVWLLPSPLSHLCLQGCLIGSPAITETPSASTSISSSSTPPAFHPDSPLACGLGTLGSLRSLDIDACTSSDWSVVAELVQGQCDLELLRLAATKPDHNLYSSADRWLLHDDEIVCSSSLRFLLTDLKMRDTAFIKVLLYYRNLQCLLLPHQALNEATASLLHEELYKHPLGKRRPCLMIVSGTNEAALNFESVLRSHGWQHIIVRTPPMGLRNFQDITEKLVNQLTVNENKERVCMLGRRIARDFRQCIRTKHPLLHRPEDELGLGSINGQPVFLRPSQGSSGFRLHPCLLTDPDEFLKPLWYNAELDVPSSFVHQRKRGKLSLDDLKQFVAESRPW